MYRKSDTSVHRIDR